MKFRILCKVFIQSVLLLTCQPKTEGVKIFEFSKTESSKLNGIGINSIDKQDKN